MTPATRARLQEVVEQWRREAAEIERDRDFCCALTREHDADALAACLAAEGEPAVCTNCNHVEPHNGPAGGGVDDACTHPCCNCGFDSRGTV